MASVLNIKPLLIIGGNKIDAYEKVRGRKNCEKRLIKAIGERVSRFKSQGYDIQIGIAGSISSHVGPNAFGMGVSVKITLQLLLLSTLKKPFSLNLRKESAFFHKKQKGHRKHHCQASQ